MQTIQDHFRTCNRKTVVNIFVNKYILTDTILLLENRDRMVSEIIDTTKDKLNGLIDRIISSDVERQNEMILLAAHCTKGITFPLVKRSEIDKDKVQSYSYILDRIDKAAGYLVADTYLTMYYLSDLLADFLFTVSWTGYNQERLEKEIKNLEEAINELRDPDNFMSYEEFSEAIEETAGLELKKQDPKQKEAWFELICRESEYDKTCLDIELEKLRGFLDEA